MRLTLGHNGIDANCVASPSAGCVTEAAKAHGFGTSGSDDGLQAERITTCPDRNECMRLALLLVFVAYPLLELALLIRAGQAIGFWPVLAIINGTGLLGVAILRRQGFKVVEKVSAALEEGREPVAPLADSALVFAAGSMLISPGLVGDTMGLLLLIPQLRHLIRHTISALCSAPPPSSYAAQGPRRRRQSRAHPPAPARLLKANGNGSTRIRAIGRDCSAPASMVALRHLRTRTSAQTSESPMADEKNGGAAATASEPGQMQVQVLGQHIKDLSFENPSVGKLQIKEGENPAVQLSK